jgi:predicted  nucleic acid-binding Zn-ribbon protein
MSQLFTKIQEIESQIDGEIRQIDKKMKELKQQRQKLTGLQKALNPKVIKPKRNVKVEADKTEDTKQNS